MKSGYYLMTISLFTYRTSILLAHCVVSSYILEMFRVHHRQFVPLGFASEVGGVVTPGIV